MLNNLVRSYIKRFDKEVKNIKMSSPNIQLDQLEAIKSSRYVRHFFPACRESSFKDHSTFVNAFQITRYKDYGSLVKELLDRTTSLKPPYYAQSSGTSGVRKILPISEGFVRTNLLRGTWYVLNTLYDRNPQMRVFNAKNLLIGGAIYQKSNNYIVGDVSGIMLSRIPWYMRSNYVPSVNIATLPDWQNKIERTALAASKTKDVAMLGGTPTWVLSVLRLVLDYTGKKKISQLWPNLQCYIHGGVHFAPYKSQFDELIDIKSFNYVEVYNATEGFFAYQDDPLEDGMLLMTGNGIYYEFMPLNDYQSGQYHSVPLIDVEIGKSYVIVISTIMGLIRYEIGDVVEFTSKNPFRLKVIGRTSEFINAFGEDLVLDHVIAALEVVNKKHKCSISNFTVAPNYISIDKKGRHDWYVEFNSLPESIEQYAKDLDWAIQTENLNYKQKRIENLAITSLNLTVLNKGFYQEYLKSKNRLGGQSKIQKLRNDRKLADEIDMYLVSQPNLTSNSA